MTICLQISMFSCMRLMASGSSSAQISPPACARLVSCGDPPSSPGEKLSFSSFNSEKIGSGYKTLPKLEPFMAAVAAPLVTPLVVLDLRALASTCAAGSERVRSAAKRASNGVVD